MLRHLTMKNPESNTDESSSRHYLLQGAQLASKQSQALQAGARSVKKKKIHTSTLRRKMKIQQDCKRLST
jgi:hypothetical protein